MRVVLHVCTCFVWRVRLRCRHAWCEFYSRKPFYLLCWCILTVSSMSCSCTSPTSKVETLSADQQQLYISGATLQGFKSIEEYRQHAARLKEQVWQFKHSRVGWSQLVICSGYRTLISWWICLCFWSCRQDLFAFRAKKCEWRFIAAAVFFGFWVKQVSLETGDVSNIYIE